MEENNDLKTEYDKDIPEDVETTESARANGGSISDIKQPVNAEEIASDEPTMPAEQTGNADSIVSDEPISPAEQTAPDAQSESAEGVPQDTESTETQDTGSAEKENIKPPKRKRGARIAGNILLVAAIALGILSLLGVMREFGPDAGVSFGEAVSNMSPLFCVVLVAVVLGGMALDVFKFCIISKTVTGKFRVRTSMKTNFIGKYYDAVTPFATGGQPMQIYYLNTKGISGGNSSAIVLIRYIFSIMCWIILGSVFMIVGTVKGVLNGVSGGNLLLVAGWVGIGVNLIVPLFVLLFLVIPKAMRKMTEGIVKLGYKMKIVKDKEKTLAGAVKIVDDFKSAFKLMATKPLQFITLLLTCFAESALTFSIPYFVMKAFSCPVDGMLFTVMSLNVFTTFGVSFIPTPGNSGVMEGMGALAFSAAAGATLVWSVLTWRLLVFYVYILIGIGITVRDIIKKNIRRKRVERGENTENAATDPGGGE